MRARTHLAPGGTKYELQRVGSQASKVQWLSQSIYIIPPSRRFCTENRVIISFRRIVLTLIKRALISKHRYPSSHVNHANDTRNERTSGRSRFISTIYIIYAHQTCVKCILQYVRYDLLQRAVTRDCAKKKKVKAERPRKNEKKKKSMNSSKLFSHKRYFISNRKRKSHSMISESCTILHIAMSEYTAVKVHCIDTGLLAEKLE